MGVNGYTGVNWSTTTSVSDGTGFYTFSETINSSTL